MSEYHSRTGAHSGPVINPQMSAFIKSVTGPVTARMLFKFLKIAAMTPVGRAVGGIVATVLLAFLLVPAAFTALLTYLATGDSAQTTQAFLLVMGLAVGVILILGYKLKNRWDRFTRTGTTRPRLR